MGGVSRIPSPRICIPLLACVKKYCVCVCVCVFVALLGWGWGRRTLIRYGSLEQETELQERLQD